MAEIKQKSDVVEVPKLQIGVSLDDSALQKLSSDCLLTTRQVDLQVVDQPLTLAQPIALARHLLSLTKHAKCDPTIDERTMTKNYKTTFEWAHATYSMDLEWQAYLGRINRKPYYAECKLWINDVVVAALNYAKQHRKQDAATSDYRQVLSLAVLIMAADGQPVNDYSPLLTESHYSLAQQLDSTLPVRSNKSSCVVM